MEKIDAALGRAEAVRAQVEEAMQAVVAEVGLVPGDVAGLADLADIATSGNGKQPAPAVDEAGPPAVKPDVEAEAEASEGADDGLDALFNEADDLEQELRERLDEPEEEAADPPADDFWASILEEEGEGGDPL
jgi:hypothetical protein